MKKYPSFHSNHNEDRWISTNLQLPKEGVFVDVGACDAITRSNTYHFEMNGWTGLCIEPDKFYFSDGKDNEGPNNPLPKFRKQSINAAIADYDGKIPFQTRNRKCLSQVWTSEFFGPDNTASYEIECFTLETILQKHNITSIDILDISCRGYDWVVWNSFNYKKYTPKVIITEYNARNYNTDYRVHDSVLNTGEYELCHTTNPDTDTLGNVVTTTSPIYVFKHKNIEYKNV